MHVYCCALFFLCICFLRLRNIRQLQIFIFLTVFLSGAACYKNNQTLAAGHISRFRPLRKDRIYEVKGAVISEPSFKNNKTVFVFKTREIASSGFRRSCCGNMIVYVKGKLDCNYGQQWSFQGNLRRIPQGYSRNQKSYRLYLNNQGIYSAMRISVKGLCVKLKKRSVLSVKGAALSLKKRLEASIYKRLSAIPASILGAMVLGEKQKIPSAIYKTMMKSGTVHILVVSGFNVGIVAFILALLLKAARIPRRPRFYISLPLLVVYCFVTGASIPVVRSTVMAVVLMFAYLVERQPDVYNACSSAALFILVLNPTQLFDIGFQLSFASVLSLVIIYPAVKRFLRLKNLKIRPLSYFLDSVLVSLSAWIGTAGFIAYYFRMVSPIAVLANIFVVPLATLITLCGFGLVFMDMLCPYMAVSFASVNELLIKLLVQVNFFLIRFPKAYFYLS
jgi:competence protein ComEC